MIATDYAAGSIVALIGAVYFTWLIHNSLRNGVVEKFTGTPWSGLIIDAIADTNPKYRWLKYLSRERHPIRFWIAIAIRILVAGIAYTLAAGFFIAAIH